MKDSITAPPLGPADPPAGVETLKVEAAADRGMAMGHRDGKVIFVPFAAPGDVLEVEVLREKPRYAEARILRIVEPSPLRRSPLCPQFGRCGGCQWQHLPYVEQLAAKARSFQELLGRRLGLRPEKLRPPIPSPKEWGYRNRVSLKVRRCGGEVEVGYLAPRSHRLVPIRACPVAHPGIGSLLGPLRGFLQGFPAARHSLPQIDLQVDGQERLWAVFHVHHSLGRDERDRLVAFAEDTRLAGALVQSGRKHSISPLRVTDPEGVFPLSVSVGGRPLDLRVSPGGFVQANPDVNQVLIDEVVAASDLYAGQPVLDLYCGSGNFTLPLALHASQVAGIEGYPPAAKDAERNARRNGLGNVRVIPGPAAEGLRVLASDGFRPLFALLDPPREGARDALDPLAALDPAWLLYVSCSPPTLARDLAILSGLGYRVRWTRMADMFPQTAHAESLTLLSRAPPR